MNRGELCAKGIALAAALSIGGRDRTPLVGGVSASWDDAVSAVARGLRAVRASHGPGAIAMRLSPQLPTEAHYLANKLMKGFLGSASIGTGATSALARAESVLRRSLGSDVSPASFGDLDAARLIVLVADPAPSPVLLSRIALRRQAGARLVVIRPATLPALPADVDLPVAAGTMPLPFALLFAAVARSASLDVGFLARHTKGFEQALSDAEAMSRGVATVADMTGLPPAAIEGFMALWLANPETVTVLTPGAGVEPDVTALVLNAHLAAGRIGRRGGGPLLLAVGSNSVGAREVGAAPHRLAAQMGFASSDVERVRRFWAAPAIVGRPGVADHLLPEAIADGRIRALWLMVGNEPDAALGLPAELLDRLDFVVISTANALADARVVLPSSCWSETDGTVTNAEHRIGRRRAFRRNVLARPDWWLIGEVGKRLGFDESFSYADAAEVFREHAALSAFENGGTRHLDLGSLATLDAAGYAALPSLRWPCRSDEVVPADGGFIAGRFASTDGRALFVSG